MSEANRSGYGIGGSAYALDIVQLACLKTHCPGQKQPATCKLLRAGLQCTDATSRGLRPRTSDAGWWLT